MYKNNVETPPLAMVDDIIGVSKCGHESIKLNNFICCERIWEQYIPLGPDMKPEPLGGYDTGSLKIWKQTLLDLGIH